MNRQNPQAQQYMKQVKRQLTCSRKQRHGLISELEQMIGMFLDDCPDASYEQIRTACGSPTEIAAELLSDIPEQEMTRIRRSKNSAQQKMDPNCNDSLLDSYNNWCM